MKILISNIITAILTIVISYSVIMASIDKKLKEQRVPETNDDVDYDLQDDYKIDETKSINQRIQNIAIRIGKIEDFVDEVSPMIYTAKTNYDKLKMKEENTKVSNNSFDSDLGTYPTDIQKMHKEYDKKSRRFMKDKEYDKCAESIQKGINLLDRKDGYVYGISQHRLTWCLYKSGNRSEARKQLENLVTSNNVGQFSNGVKVATKAKVDLFRVCMQDKDYDCIDRLESDLIDIGSERYTSNKIVDEIVRGIKSKYN